MSNGTAASTSPDIVIIGSGMGGATAAFALAPTGAKIVILEKGHQLPEKPENRDAHAIFGRGHFRPDELWYDVAGAGFNPGNYYNHGGNSKFYGAVLIRYRAQDFDGVAHADGDAPAWPFRYADLSPWYDEAEALYEVRGSIGEDPTEPPHGRPYPHRPVPDERAIAEVRARLSRIGLHPSSLPLGVDIDRWMAVAKTPWDAFPDARSGKMDAETCALLPALEFPNVRLESGADVRRLIPAPDGRRISGVEYEQQGETRNLTAPLVILAAGAVRSAAILLASGSGGLANRSGMVGRHFMNHNLSAVLGLNPRFVNDSIYQKTFGLNDFYLSDGKGGPPLGNIQLLGRVSGPILKANMPRIPLGALNRMSRHSVDFLAMSEDLPDPSSRVRLDGSRIVLDWHRTNMSAHAGLVKRLKQALRAAGFPAALSRLFDRKTPSHQCGTIRLGTDPAQAPLDPFGRSFDHPNLFVLDASALVTSAAVNPSLTIAALSLRAADHIRPDGACGMSRPVALVTGARRGIGRAIAIALARGGYDLALTDIDDEAEEACDAIEHEGGQAFFTHHDVAREETHAGLVEAVLKRFGALHCFVSNAGIGSVSRGDMLDLSPEHFDRVLGVNLRGAALLSQTAAKAILATQGGPKAMVFVTSVSAGMVSPERADYCVSKAGLSMWAQALAVRLAPDRVPVFEVRPGIIHTAMTAKVSETYDRRIAAGLVPAGRWGEPDDVGRMVAALVSGAFGFASGTILACDGALSVPRL